MQSLEEIVDIVDSVSLKIIFFFYYRQHFEMERGVSSAQLFDELCFRAYEEFDGCEQGVNRRLFVFSQRKEKSWKWLQECISLIKAKTGSQVDLSTQVEQLTQSIEKARSHFESNNDQFD